MKLKLPLKVRRILGVLLVLIGVGTWVILNPASYEQILIPQDVTSDVTEVEGGFGRVGGNDGAASETDLAVGATSENVDLAAPLATEVLEKLEVKGRAPKTGYSREEFYQTWPTVDGCSLRQEIIKREFGASAVLEGCDVVAGEFDEPYTGEHKAFTEKGQISKGVQIDHVVALSDAWQKGAQYLDSATRYQMATDPLNLLAVDASANQGKSDGDAATWLPSNKRFRCQYVARQVSVKYKYSLWVSEAEKNAIAEVLASCPNQRAIGVTL